MTRTPSQKMGIFKFFSIILLLVFLSSANCEKVEKSNPCEVCSSFYFSSISNTWTFNNGIPRVNSQVAWCCSFTQIKSMSDFKNALTKSNGNASFIRSIKLEDSQFEEISPEFFTLEPELTNIGEISAKNIGIQVIKPNTFESVIKFELLDFSENEITKIYNKTFFNVQVGKLNLSNNKISVIQADAFEGFDGSLDLSSNQLKTLKFVENFESLNLLDLSRNDFEEISLNRELDRITFQKLIFNENEHLKKFECGSLYLPNVEMTNNPQLTEIDNLCQIDSLNIENNKNLRDLELTHEEAIVTKLRMAYDSSLSKKALEGVFKTSTLVALDASYIKIGDIKASTFSEMSNLLALNLTSTGITKINYGAFSKLNLQTLILADNNLIKINFNLFSSLYYLNSVDLSGNKMKFIRNAHVMKGKYVNIRNNDFSCETLAPIVKALGNLSANELAIHEDDSVIDGVRCSNVPTEVTIEDLTEKLYDVMNILVDLQKQLDRNYFHRCQ